MISLLHYMESTLTACCNPEPVLSFWRTRRFLDRLCGVYLTCDFDSLAGPTPTDDRNRDSANPQSGKGTVMSRSRKLALALALVLATSTTGCVTFCDDCDEFPSPGGPGGYSMMPGSYTGPPLRKVSDAPPVRSTIENQAPSSGTTSPPLSPVATGGLPSTTSTPASTNPNGGGSSTGGA